MSASKAKKDRIESKNSGENKKSKAELERQEKDRKYKRNATIITVLVVVFIVFSIVFSSTLFYSHTTAINIGGTNYSAAEFSYYYQTVRQSYSGANVTAEDEYPLADDTIKTYGDFWYQQAVDQLTEITMLYNRAVAEGVTVSDEYQENIDLTLQNMELYGQYSGLGSAKAYLAANYCRGLTPDLLREVLTKYYTALTYEDQLYDSFEYTSEEKEAYYTEHKDELDIIKVQSFYVNSSSSDAYASLEGDELADAMYNDALMITNADTVEQFIANIKDFVGPDEAEQYDDPSKTLVVTSGSSVNPEYSDWALDPERQPGDVYVTQNTSGCYALMFVERNDNHYNTVSVRHILVRAEADENGEYTDEAIAQAEGQIDAILEQYNADPSEETFAALAKDNSADTGSAEDGGLIENIYRDQMVPEFDEFCFSEHEKGDVEKIFVQSDNYTGYHLVYYIGEGQPVSEYFADSAMRSADYQAEIDAAVADVPVSRKVFMKFANLD